MTSCTMMKSRALATIHGKFQFIETFRKDEEKSLIQKIEREGERDEHKNRVERERGGNIVKCTTSTSMLLVMLQT